MSLSLSAQTTHLMSRFPVNYVPNVGKWDTIPSQLVGNSPTYKYVRWFRTAVKGVASAVMGVVFNLLQCKRGL